MRFQVPQFIEVEDKIFGPLTFKQFLYVGGGVGICVVLFTFLNNVLAFFLSIPVAILAGALAFFKVNDKPFINVVEAFFKYHTNDKLYLWEKKENKPEAKDATPKPIEQVHVPKLSESKLKDLTWSLDVQENKQLTTNNPQQTLNNEPI